MKKPFGIAGAFLVILSIHSCDKNDVSVIKDGDGNVYTAVAIGKQLWLNENLKTTRYNDGTPIPLVTDFTAWNNLPSHGYCWYDNDEDTYKAIYGGLYNWFTIAGSGNLDKNICPIGWHVPTTTEWTTLTTFLGGETNAGGKLKENGTTHWISPNTGATDEYNFTALPGGDRNNNGSFYNIGLFGSWWCAPESYDDSWMREIPYNSSHVAKYNADQGFGLSVRCIKD